MTKQQLLRFIIKLRLQSLAFLIFVFGVYGFPGDLYAQVDPSRVLPGDGYFLAISNYQSGEYKDALKDFTAMARPNARRWIDSICYHTMAGECYYQMGNLTAAVEQYETALKFFLVHKDWLRRIQFPATLGPKNPLVKSSITWGVSKRATSTANLPDKMSSFQGRLDNTLILQQGGIVAPPVLFPVRVQEIVRCTALALRRRLQIMGPTCRHTVLTNELVIALAARPAQANHWSQRWIDVLHGLAQASSGRTDSAIRLLESSLTLQGTYDHPLTATSLLELGKLALSQKKYPLAANYFLEATYAAVPYSQADIIAEGFRYGLITHIVQGGGGLYPPLLLAPNWKHLRNFDALHANLLVMASENQTFIRGTTPAAALAAKAKGVRPRNDMWLGNIGARHQYQLALVNYQNGNLRIGDRALATAMAYQKNASQRLFQIALADQMYQSGDITPREASLLYAEVLRAPSAVDWQHDPLESLSVLATPPIGPLETWFEIAISRREYELALDISDRIRRRRFYSSLPMGGRLLSLRWVLEAPQVLIPRKAFLERQALLAKYPNYAELSRQSAEIRNQLDNLPWQGIEGENLDIQKKLTEQWSRVSESQEIQLREIALRRDPSEFVFPPLIDSREIQAAMPPRQIALVYFATSRFIYAFMFSNEGYEYWQIESPRNVRRQLASLLRELGHFNKNQQLSVEHLKSDKWRQSSSELLQVLTNNRPTDFWDQYDELVIVPDGILWYVPFEALQIQSPEGYQSLSEKVRVRHLPTSSLIATKGKSPKPSDRAAVVLGKLYPQDDVDIAEQAFQELTRSLPGSKVIKEPLPSGSSYHSPIWDRLIVFDDIESSPKKPFDWSPAQVDQGKSGSTLASWLRLPWGGPEQLVLPGFHSAAEDGLKGNASGDEMFLVVCGLMSTGTRSILLSRWRTGGRTSYDLVREYAQELPYTSAANAWQRSLLLAMQTELDDMNEPRLKLTNVDQTFPAEHPFFWAGYLLIDTDAGQQQELAKEQELDQLGKVQAQAIQ